MTTTILKATSETAETMASGAGPEVLAVSKGTFCAGKGTEKPQHNENYASRRESNKEAEALQ